MIKFSPSRAVARPSTGQVASITPSPSHLQFPSPVRICHFNCQSLLCHFTSVRDFILTSDFHIVAISETWLSSALPDCIFCVKDYTFFRSDSLRHRYGGVCFYVHNSIKAYLIGRSSDQGTDQLEFEFMLLRVNISTQLYCVIGVIYRPPNASVNCLESLISETAAQHKYTIWMGDLNIDMNRCTTDSFILQLILNIGNFYLVPYQGTHRIDHSCTWIDHMFVSTELTDLLIASDQTHAAFISAHDRISIHIDLRALKATPSTVIRRRYVNIERDELNISVAEKLEARGDVFQNSTVDVQAEVVNTVLTEQLDIYAPLTSVRVNNRPYLPWITRDIRNLMRLRETYRRAYRRHGDQHSGAQYKRLRGYVKGCIATARRKYLENSLDIQDQNAMWKELARLKIVRGRRRQAPTPLVLDPNSLNSYFHSVQLSSCTPFPSHDLSPSSSSPSFDDTLFYFSHITPLTFLESFSFSNSFTAPSDNLPPIFLALCSSSVFSYLLDLCNSSLTSGVFPASWKRSLITPIPKIPNPLTPSDFRPISILPEMSKVLERVVLKDVLAFVHLNNLHDPYQYAYRSGLSTQTAVLKLITDIRNATDNGLTTLAVCFDLSKAFDTVDHKLLLGKLRSFRFSPSVCKWFQSYLTGRTQAVRCSGRISESLEVISGVPQGSVLRPFLFSLFITDLNKVIRFGKIIKYADDLLLYFHLRHTDISDWLRKVEADIENVVRWVAANGLVLNSEKTRCIAFGSPRLLQLFHSSLPVPYVTVSSSKIPFSSTIKYLGLTISASLSWSEQVALVCGRIYGVLASLAQNRRSLSLPIKKKLISTLVLPHVDYCCLALVGLSVADELRLQRALNAAIRFIFNLNRDEHITLYRLRLRWLSVRDRRCYFLARLMFNIFHRRAPFMISDFFTKTSDRFFVYSTRNPSDLFIIPRHRTAFFECAIPIQGSRLWNALPRNVREREGSSAFAEAVYEFLLRLGARDDTYASCERHPLLRVVE